MSDELGATLQPAATGPWVHLCEHPGCKAWGGWGFASGKGRSRWFCYAHREDGTTVNA